MKKFVKLAESQGAEYAEIISASSERSNIELLNKEIKELSSGNQKGYAVRVLYHGGWGTAYSYKDDFKSLIVSAIKKANAMGPQIEIGNYPAFRKKLRTPCKQRPEKISLEEKKENLLKLDNRQGFKSVSSLKLLYSEGISVYSFVNSEGSDLEWEDYNTAFMAWAFAKQNGKLENFFKIERIKGGYEVMKKAKAAVAEAMQKAEAMLNAKPAKGGFFPTIVDQKLGGVFAHEAVGHACEADLVLNNSSILAGKIGEKVGSDIVSITDDGNLREWGWTPFDSEGAKASKTTLIKDGILKSFLHNRETAKILNAKLTGNGRSQSLSQKVIPRMTNTYIEPGKSSFNKMIAEIKEGYYLKGSAGGQVNPASGEFLFNAQEGYEIKNGQIAGMVKGVSLVGSILQTLHQIKMVAKDLELGGGYCGKSNQLVPVSDGSPHLLVHNAKIGGSQ